jgi:hypothetical protein
MPPSIQLRADIRDNNYLPLADATAEARLLGPGGLADSVALLPDPQTPASTPPNGRRPSRDRTWSKSSPGAASRRSPAMWRPSAARTASLRTSARNRIANSSTAGRPDRRPLLLHGSASDLIDEIDFSEAGLSVRETHDLWDMPLAFLLLAALKAAEWLLRRRWGAV